jgi:hypothetical protein
MRDALKALQYKGFSCVLETRSSIKGRIEHMCEARCAGRVGNVDARAAEKSVRTLVDLKKNRD